MNTKKNNILHGKNSSVIDNKYKEQSSHLSQIFMNILVWNKTLLILGSILRPRTFSPFVIF
jgi:hypothetical protein